MRKHQTYSTIILQHSIPHVCILKHRYVVLYQYVIDQYQQIYVIYTGELIIFKIGFAK
ncbi:hypothetical protein VCR31J2_1310109 [Vibrio coralliirubri]|uniref:Uncharacterized protein n=1 Tax=Vibrio coralliirubri TaxID=1516159 RepID=A0AA86WQA3_9VIBR|nr:hypothetical protein VCR31J2_1310109 [Vibrio coralliirubri]